LTEFFGEFTNHQLVEFSTNRKKQKVFGEFTSLWRIWVGHLPSSSHHHFHHFGLVNTFVNMCHTRFEAMAGDFPFLSGEVLAVFFFCQVTGSKAKNGAHSDISPTCHESLDWFKGKSKPETHGFYH